MLMNRPETNVNLKTSYITQFLTEYMPILHEAINSKNINIVELILSSSNIDINIKSYKESFIENSFEKYEETALNKAILNDKNDIIQVLLSQPKIELNIGSKRVFMNKDKCFTEERTVLQTCVLTNKYDSFKIIAEYLKKNNQINRNILNDLLCISNDDKMKSLINSYK